MPLNRCLESTYCCQPQRFLEGEVAVALTTLLMPAAGGRLAARYGDFSMRAGEHTMKERMEMPVGHEGMAR